MTTQINLRIADSFLDNVKEHAKAQGYLNIQEFIREAIREKLYDELEVKSEYLERLKSKDANTFSSVENSKKIINKLRKKVSEQWEIIKQVIFFEKNIGKLKGQELKNVLKKIDDILLSQELDHYKNLRYDLKKYKRVHVNDSYVILFFGNDNIVYFVDYNHHDNMYKHSKKFIKKYKSLKFE